MGQGVDSGPSDIGHELHAKIEEAAEKALAIIEHAGKYLDDAAKEQSKQDAALIDINDKDEKLWEREKRQVQPVPQTDSDAAKGTHGHYIKILGKVWEFLLKIQLIENFWNLAQLDFIVL